jgi:hypothetical protein
MDTNGLCQNSDMDTNGLCQNSDMDTNGLCQNSDMDTNGLCQNSDMDTNGLCQNSDMVIIVIKLLLISSILCVCRYIYNVKISHVYKLHIPTH